jgi:hypothetical protein
MLKRLGALALLSLCPFFLSAETTVVGIPVAGDGVSTQLPTANVSSNGTIRMWLPLEGGTEANPLQYGVNGVGISSSVFDSDATNGFMEMWLYFSPNEVPAASAVLDLKFKDLDLIGVNDPHYFLESVQITTMGASVEATSASDAVSANNHSQTISIDLIGLGLELDADDEELWTRLLFNVQNNYAGNAQHLINTKETMRATLTTTAVPEPATYAILGAGLLVAAARRRQQTA